MPKIVDRQEMRADLLAGCFGLFARKGFAAVTMRDLAKELEVSTGTLYHYFTNKSELFDQMLRHLVERDTVQVLRSIEGITRPAERVRVLLAYIADREEHFKALLFLLFDFKRQQGQHKADAFRELLGVYRDTIAQNLGVNDARLGGMVLSLIVGTLVQRVVDPSGTSLGEVQDFLYNALAQA